MPELEPITGTLSSSSSQPFEDVMETDVPFSQETPGRTLGRLAWLTSRGTAEFMITLTDRAVGLSPAQINQIYDAFSERTSDFYDFVAAGLGTEDTLDEGEGQQFDYHPLQDRLEVAIEDLEEVIEKCDEGDIEPEFDTLGLGIDCTGQDLIDLLRRRGDELPSETKSRRTTRSLPAE